MKESFILYKSYYEPIKTLNNEDLGILFRAIFEYQINGTDFNGNGTVFMAYNFIKSQLERDEKKWKLTCEGRSLAGKKSGEARKLKGTRTKRTNVKFVEQNEQNEQMPTKRTDNVNDTVNENVNVKENNPPLSPQGELSDKDISILIKNWQKIRIQDFQINGTFSTGRVVKQRSRLAGLTLPALQEFFKEIRLALKEDLTLDLILDDHWDPASHKQEVKHE